jgi:hypothetical protein
VSESISIKSCASREEAEFFKALLESKGIHASVMADDYIGLPLLTPGGVQLQVLEENVASALEIIEQARQQD